MIEKMHFNLITVLAFIFMVNFGEGSWTGFDTFLSLIGLIVAIKSFCTLAELDWFSIMLTSSILAISSTNLVYFLGQLFESLGELLVWSWGDNEFWLFITLTVLISLSTMAIKLCLKWTLNDK